MHMFYSTLERVCVLYRARATHVATQQCAYVFYAREKHAWTGCDGISSCTHKEELPAAPCTRESRTKPLSIYEYVYVYKKKMLKNFKRERERKERT